jgi:hypothetical protein
MSRWRLFPYVLLVAGLCLTSCCIGDRDQGFCDNTGTRWRHASVHGSGRVVTEGRDVEGFTAVKLSTIGKLYIEVGDAEDLRIEAEDNILECLETNVQGDMLRIRNRPNTNLRPTKPVEYYLTVRELDEISLSSSGDAVAGDLEADRFTISISSSGEFELDKLTAREVDVGISSSGDVDLAWLEADLIDVSISSSGNLRIAGGKVESQRIRISSSGDYLAENLVSREARARLSSSGTARIMVSDHLDAGLSSSGSVYYSGNPTVRKRISSSGRLKHVGKGT